MAYRVQFYPALKEIRRSANLCRADRVGTAEGPAMMKSIAIRLDDIYVPTARRGTLDAARVQALAEDILDNGLKVPIQVRRDKDRYVLVAGLHRLEAMRALGNDSIEVLVVQARKF
jgi:hypothetical protein